jgi:hypothetical protein
MPTNPTPDKPETETPPAAPANTMGSGEPNPKTDKPRPPAANPGNDPAVGPTSEDVEEAPKKKSGTRYVVTGTMLSTENPETGENLRKDDVVGKEVFGESFQRYKDLKVIRIWTSADEEAAAEARGEVLPEEE